MSLFIIFGIWILSFLVSLPLSIVAFNVVGRFRKDIWWDSFIPKAVIFIWIILFATALIFI